MRWGGLQLLLATLGAELFTARMSFVVTLIGMVWTLGGTQMLRKLAFPLFLLFFMVPIPAVIYSAATFKLQILASQLADGALTVLSVPVLREGNVLELPNQKLSVVEACSGIRSLLSLTFLSLVYGYFFERKTWVRAVLFFSTIPIAIIANASRVTMTGIMTQIKAELAEGFFHEAEGWVIFMVALVILIVWHQVLIRGEFRGSQEGPVSFFKNRYARVVTVLLLLQGLVFYAVALRAETTPAPAPLASLSEPLERLADVQRRQDGPGNTGRSEGGRHPQPGLHQSCSATASAFLFVAFFKTQRTGQAPHSPKNCLPGNGYEPIESGQIQVAVPGRAEPVEINRYLTARGDEKSVTLYWYQSHDRVIAGEFSAKFWLIADSIRYHRSDTSLVKVVVPVRNNDADAATKTAIEFVKAVFAAA